MLSVLLGTATLGLPPAAAQEGAQRQAGPEDASNRCDPRDDPACYFFEDFAGTELDRQNWEHAVGVTPTSILSTDGQTVAAARLGWDRHPADRPPELRSVVIPLAGVPGVELAYTVRQQGVESGEALLVEYFAADGRWRVVERLVADGRSSAALSRKTQVLPVDALHARFRLRFRPAIDDEDDTWMLGEVSVAGYDPLQTLAVRVHPPHDAQVEVVLAGRTDATGLDVPFSRRYPLGARLYLVAPPAVDEQIFSHWTVDSGVRVRRQRVLTLDMTESIEAVAHYRPRVAGRNQASVAIVSEPLPDVPIALGMDPEAPFTEICAATEYPCLTGEWLTLLAPPRTERMVFVGWVVNGQRLPGGDNLLEHRVSADDVLLAEYVRLGDVNGDDLLDKYDVDLFLAALVDPLGYAEVYPDLDPLQRGDINGDGAFDEADIGGFVDLLLND